MIVEIVTFDLPPGTSREEALQRYQETAHKWAANSDLHEKWYFYDAEKALGGGVYIWKSREAAERWHGSDYRKMVADLYGSPPRIEIRDAHIRVDPGEGAVHIL